MLNQRQLVVQHPVQSARHCHSTENIERIAGNPRSFLAPPPPPPAPSTRQPPTAVAAAAAVRQKKRRSIFSFRSTYGKYQLTSPASNDLQRSNSPNASKLPRSATTAADCRLAQCVDMCQNLALEDMLFADAEAIDQDLVNRNVVLNSDMTRSWHAETALANSQRVTVVAADNRRSASPVQVNGPTNRLFQLNVIKRWSTRSRSSNCTNTVAVDNASGSRRKSSCSTSSRTNASSAGDVSHIRPAVRRTRPRSAHFNPNTIVAAPKQASDAFLRPCVCN